MYHTLNISKPCTVFVDFSQPVGNTEWKVSTGDTVYHVRAFKPDIIGAKISFPKSGKYYSNKGISSINIMPLETYDVFDKLPEPERDYNPDSIYVQKMESLAGTPARTWAKDGLIQTGKDFESFPSQVKFFILLHELGHQKYMTEWKTDLFALAQFLKLGYNESQAFYALTRVLDRTPDNVDRIYKMYNILKNK